MDAERVAVTTLRGRGPRAVLLLSDFTERMAPVGAAEKAALDAFFKGKRGERVLIEHPPSARTWRGPPHALVGEHGRGRAATRSYG